MKKLVLAAALAGFASTSFAGGIDDPIVAPDIIIDDTQGSSAGVILPLILLAVILAAASD